MSVYFIADLHFDDENIRVYENRPFENVEEMNRAIIDNWNSTVSEDDEVYLVGDIGNEKHISELKGRKYLVKGNHDKLSNEEYRKLGFTEVYDKPIIFNDFWMVSHEPMYVNKNMPYANIFGHVHANPAYRTVSERSYWVGVERIGYTPISFEEIAMAVQEEDNKKDS